MARRHVLALFIVTLLVIALLIVHGSQEDGERKGSLASSLLQKVAAATPDARAPRYFAYARRRERMASQVGSTQAQFAKTLRRSARVAPARLGGRTLVMYVFHESSDWYVDNLRFFIEVRMFLLRKLGRVVGEDEEQRRPV